ERDRIAGACDGFEAQIDSSAPQVIVISRGGSLHPMSSARRAAGCHGPQGPCDFASVGLITNQANSTFHAGQLALSRRFSNGLSFLGSYTYSKTLDYVSLLM